MEKQKLEIQGERRYFLLLGKNSFKLVFEKAFCERRQCTTFLKTDSKSTGDVL